MFTFKSGFVRKSNPLFEQKTKKPRVQGMRAIFGFKALRGHGRTWSALSWPSSCCSWPPVDPGSVWPSWWCFLFVCRQSGGAHWSLCCLAAVGSASQCPQRAHEHCGGGRRRFLWTCSQTPRHKPDPLPQKTRVVWNHWPYITSHHIMAALQAYLSAPCQTFVLQGLH